MIWKDIEGYEGLYQVSDAGEVRSLDRITTGNRNRKINGKVLAKLKTGTGYYRVDLCKNGKTKRHKVHRLVAKAFIENPNNKPFVNHIDNNPLNNNVSNLEWCTASENSLHSVRCGRWKERSHASVATKEIVEKVFEEYVPYKKDKSILAISKKIGISASTLYSAKRRNNYGRSYL